MIMNDLPEIYMTATNTSQIHRERPRGALSP